MNNPSLSQAGGASKGWGDLKSRLLFVLGALIVFRFGTHELRQWSV